MANGIRPAPQRRKLLFVIVFIAVVALFWASAWQAMDRSVLMRVPMLDEVHYLRSAHALIASGWRAEGPFYMSPLYTILVAAVGSGRELDDARVRKGPPPWGLRLMQSLLWLGTAWLLLRVGAALLGSRWGWLPPLLWLFYLPGAVLASQALLEVPLAFTTTLALTVAGRWAGPRSLVARALLSGACVGLSMLLRGTSVVLLLPVVWMLAWKTPEAAGAGSRARDLAGSATGPCSTTWRRHVPLLLAPAAAALVVLPFSLWNSALAGRPVGPSLNGGVNLYLGNAEQANGFFQSLEGFDMERDPGGAAYLSARLGRTIEGLAEADSAWSAMARQQMARHPGRSTVLWLRKLRLHLAALEIPQISTLSAWRAEVPVFRFLILPWGLLSAGALAGAWFGSRRVPELRPWLMGAVLLIMIQSLFFVVTRYRLILVPAFALATGVALRALCMARGRQLALGMAMAAVATLAVWPWNLGFAREQFAVQGLENLAIRWTHLARSHHAQGDQAAFVHGLRTAEAHYRRVLAGDPRSVRSRLEAARVRWTLQDTTGALDILAGHPGGLAADVELPRLAANMMLAAGRGSDAAPFMHAVLLHEPDNTTMLFNLSLVLLRLGWPQEALALAQRLREIEPDTPRSDLVAAEAFLALGAPQEARRVLNEGLRRLPGHPDLMTMLRELDAPDGRED